MKDMVEAAALPGETRAKLLARPEVILEDRDLMRALIAANDAAMGDNVIDMRGLAMQRLEGRLDQLEDVHQSVIAAAYENLAGTELIHRAVLCLLEAGSFAETARLLDGPLAEVLRVDRIRLVLESEAQADGPPRCAAPGWIARYLTRGSRAMPRRVTLRPIQGDLYGADFVGSEACLALDLGPDRLPGLLGLGVADPEHYHHGQGTDFLDFFAGVVERVLRRWPG